MRAGETSESALRGHMRMLLLLLLSWLPLLLPGCAAGDVTAPPLRTGLIGNAPEIRIAVVVNCLHPTLPDPPLGGQMLPEDFDITACSLGISDNDEWFKSYITYDRVVRESGGIPTSTGYRAPLKFVYFNIGPMNYQADVATIGAQYAKAAQNALILSQLLGLYGGQNENGTFVPGAPCPHCLLPPQLAPPGIYGRFPVVIAPPLGDFVPNAAGIPQSMTEPFFIGCQLSKQCIVFGYYSGTEDWKKCRPRMQYGPAATPTNPDFINRVPPECTKDKDPTLIADKRPTSRRFDFGFSVLASQNAIVATMVSWFKQYKAETAVFCSTTEKSFVTNFLPPAYAAFTANKIRLLGETTYLPLNGVAWTDDEALAFALHVRDLNPDVLVMLVASTYPGDIQSGAKLITKFREIDYLPKAILMPGGGNQYVATLLNWLRPNLETSDAAFIYGSASNSFAMRGANYDAQTGTGADAVWEPYPSDGQTLSNQALLREYLKDWNDTTPLSLYDGDFAPMTVQAPLIYACKLVYLAGSDDAKLMQLASVSLSAPSAFGLAQFDNYGLPADSSHYVQQNAQNGKKLHLITPLDVGVPDVYPMPTWSERIRPTDQGGAVFQGMPMEKAIMAVTTVAIVYLLALMAGVIIWRNHPVMKAATPPLCVLVILGGAVCIASNYGTSLYALPSGCAASAWLLTCGATLCYGSIVLKTHRIYRIFNSAKLSVVKISNRDLYVMIAVALGVDVVLNSIWSGVGFDTEYITIDPYRPSRDYVECAYDSRALVLVFIQLAYKLMLLVACLVLTILTRSVPSAFNEALLLGGATYNSFVLLAFVLPLVAAQVGSREVTHAIRSFGILVIITSTVSILFLPKFCTIARPDSTRVLSLRKAAAHTPALGVTDPYAVDEPAGQAESHAAMKGRSPQQQQRGRMSAAGDDALSQGEDGMRPFSGHSHLQQSIPFGSMAIPSQASLPLSSQPGIVAPFPSVMLAAHSLPPPGAPGGGVVGAPHSASTDSATMLRKMESADGGASSTDDSPLQQHLQRIHQENVLLRRRIAQLESTSQTQATTNSSGSHTSFNINVPGSAYSSN